MRVDLDRAWLLYELGRPEQALAALAPALAADPNDPDALALAALLHLALGDVQRAVEAARQAVAAAPELAEAHHALAYVLAQAGDPRGANLALDEALRLDPTLVRAHLLRGYLALAASDWPRALAAADAGLAQEPTDPACLTLAAQALRRLGRLAEADERARLGLASAPESAAAHDTRGWVLLQQGLAAAALAHFEEALRHDPHLEHAREGLLNALRGRYAPYRWFLRARLRFAYLGSGATFALVAVVIGILYLASHHVPEPWGGWICVLVLFGGLGGFVLLQLADPCMNALLALHPRGRWALRPHQLLGARVMLGLLGAIAVLTPLAYLTGNFAAGYLAAAALALTLPTAVTFDRRGERRRKLLGYLLFGLGMLALFPLLAYQLDPVMGLFIGAIVFPLCLFFGVLGDNADAHASGV